MTHTNPPAVLETPAARPERDPAKLRLRSLLDARGLFAALALAAVIPVLLFTAWTAYLTANRDRDSVRRNVSEVATQVARRLESEIQQELQIAETLALSATLDAPNLEAFHREATRVVRARDLWETISLADPNGVQILNTLRPLGEKLGLVSDQESLHAAVQGRNSVVGGIGKVGVLSGKRLVSLRVPVFRDGNLRYVLSVGLLPDQITTILRDAGAPEGWLGAVVDASGKIVARTASEKFDVGSVASASVRNAIARGDAGFYRGISVEGVELESVYRTLHGTNGWTLHFGVPARSLDAPVSRSFGLLLAGGLASVALAIGLGLLIAREVALRRANENMLSALALKASEQRRALAVDAAQLGTWRWDIRTNELTGSYRFRSLLGFRLTPPQATWSFDRILDHVHPDDRVNFMEFAKHCVDSANSVMLDFRSLDEDGAESWRRIVGRGEQSGVRDAGVIHGVLADIAGQKQAEIERAQLLRRLAATQEAEQRRISRELHDQVGQTITGLLLGLKHTERLIEGGEQTSILEQLRRMQDLTNRVSREIHQAASDLRPAALDDFGLYRSLEAYVAEWTGRYGIPVDLQVLGPTERLPVDVETALFRCVQETLTNVIKHAHAGTVSIVCERRGNDVIIAVEDDGVGFDVGTLTRSPHPWSFGLGLSGMRERLALVGGSLNIESAPAAGTTIFIQAPLSGDATP
jgi:signal transduction histidine kinase